MFNEKALRKGLLGFDLNRVRLNFWCGVSEFADKRAEKIKQKQINKLSRAMQKAGMNEGERLMMWAMIRAYNNEGAEA